MSADLPVEVRRLVDKDAIVDLVHRYSFGVDHRLHDEVVSLFTAHCVVDFGPEFSPIHGRDVLRAALEHPDAAFRATSHHNANVLVGFDDDDHATVRTSVYAWHQRDDRTTPQVWGYYHDTVVREPEGWRIATRQLRVLGVEDWPTVMHRALDAYAPRDSNPEPSD